MSTKPLGEPIQINGKWDFFRNVPGARNSTRWLLGPPRANHRRRGALGRGDNREPPVQNLSLCSLRLLHTQSLSCEYRVPDGCFFSRGPTAPCPASGHFWTRSVKIVDNWTNSGSVVPGVAGWGSLGAEGPIRPQCGEMDK